jgi:hypothetical protein
MTKPREPKHPWGFRLFTSLEAPVDPQRGQLDNRVRLSIFGLDIRLRELDAKDAAFEADWVWWCCPR